MKDAAAFSLVLRVHVHGPTPHLRVSCAPLCSPQGLSWQERRHLCGSPQGAVRAQGSSSEVDAADSHAHRKEAFQLWMTQV